MRINFFLVLRANAKQNKQKGKKTLKTDKQTNNEIESEQCQMHFLQQQAASVLITSPCPMNLVNRVQRSDGMSSAIRVILISRPHISPVASSSLVQLL